MFEAGKKYTYTTTGTLYECLWSDKEHALLKKDGVAPSVWSHWYFKKNFTEYKEPIKHIRYFNVYPERVSTGHKSRQRADSVAMRDRIGCVRVEFTEGQYDD